MVDGGNDSGVAKMLYPFEYFISIMGVLCRIFFNLNMLEGRTTSSAEQMFNSVGTKSAENDIFWRMMSAIGVGNTNKNIGTYNSIKTRALAKNKEIVIAGCPCHILHDAVGKVADLFGEISGFDVENHFLDVFYWFDKSS